MTDMRAILRNLPTRRESSLAGGDPCYSLDAIRKTFAEVVELIPGNAWLALQPESDSDLIKYVLFTFCLSDVDSSNTEVNTVFHGYGFSGGLREMRHTWFTTDVDGDTPGYLFYAPTKAIAAAFKYLEKFFDL